jgi:hypothetical protein
VKADCPRTDEKRYDKREYQQNPKGEEADMRAFRIMTFVFLLSAFFGCDREGIYDLASHEDSIQVLYSNDAFATTSWDVSHNDVGFPDVLLPGSSQLHFKIINISEGNVVLTANVPATPIVELLGPFSTTAPLADLPLLPGGDTGIFTITFNPTVAGEYYSPAYIRYLDVGDSQEWVYGFEVRGWAY